MSVSKTIRFEVFKRDSFTCQYCGDKAPEVILEVDHINPVANGGESDLRNLITACFNCNRGKRDKPLDENSAIEKQHRQLAELQEKREQMGLMIQWQKELMKLDDDAVDMLTDLWNKMTPGFSLTDHGKEQLIVLLKRFQFSELIEAMKISSSFYLNFDEDKYKASVQLAFSKIGGICQTKKQEKYNPHLRDIFYVRGILKKKLDYFNERWAMSLMTKASALEDAHVFFGSLIEFTKTVKSWTQWRENVEEVLDIKNDGRECEAGEGEG